QSLENLVQAVYPLVLSGSTTVNYPKTWAVAVHPLLFGDLPPALELPPCWDYVGVLVPIKPLYGVSFKVHGGDVHHRSLRRSVITKLEFRARKSSRRSPSSHQGNDLVGLGDRPNMNSAKRARSISSIRILRASNLAPIRSTDAMT
ncbi:hypothetical protein BHE74_00038581, partial [Ensete ventricosum]